MGLETIGLALTIGSAAMSIAQGFAQANTQRAIAKAQEQAATQTLYMQRSAVERLEREQAVAATEATSTRIATAQRQLGTLQAVMSERGVSGATYTGFLSDLTNSESLDVARIGVNYSNQIASDESRIDAAGQDYENKMVDAEMRASAAGRSAWLNAFGTALKVGGSYVGTEMKLTALEKSYQSKLDLYNKTGVSELDY